MKTLQRNVKLYDRLWKSSFGRFNLNRNTKRRTGEHFTRNYPIIRLLPWPQSSLHCRGGGGGWCNSNKQVQLEGQPSVYGIRCSTARSLKSTSLPAHLSSEDVEVLEAWDWRIPLEKDNWGKGRHHSSQYRGWKSKRSLLHFAGLVTVPREGIS